METFGGLLYRCFGEPRGLEEATRNSGVASERCGGADFHFNVVEGSVRFDDAVPAEGRLRFGERGSLAGRFAAIGARFHGSQNVTVENEAQYDIKSHGGEREGCAHFASRTL